ncbi:MAG: hypothetical protein LUE13_03125, partial [Akkermansiaceae bacterium]|nr:hypothetical protein [Akkermansiaceae bacterium]
MTPDFKSGNSIAQYKLVYFSLLISNKLYIMRPHLPLSLLSALLACFVSPSWSGLSISGNGETNVNFSDGVYTIETPGQTIDPSENSPGNIILTEFIDGQTSSDENNDLFERTLNLKGGTYTGVYLVDSSLVGQKDFPKLMNDDNKFVINFSEGAGLSRAGSANSFLLQYSGRDRIIHGDVTVNVAQDAGSFGGLAVSGSNNGGKLETYGTYTLNINGGTWEGATNNDGWCLAFGGKGFTHSGTVNYNIGGGTFAGSISVGGVIDGGNRIKGDVNIAITGGTFGGALSLFGTNGMNY